MAPEVYPAHHPEAIVVCCSDARVPPTAVFDRPPGALFVVRVAGQVVGPEAIASIDYAVSALEVPLIIVLGHTDCGVAQAAVAGNTDWQLAPLVEPLEVLVENNPQVSVNEVVEANVIRIMSLLAGHNGLAGTAIRARTVAIRGGVYDLRTDLVSPVKTDTSDWY